MCVHKSREAYIDYHADSGQGGRKVLRVWRSDVYGNTSGVETAVEGGNQINACEGDGRHRLSERNVQNSNTHNGKTVAGLTGRIEQHHILSSVDAAFLCECSCNLLRTLV